MLRSEYFERAKKLFDSGKISAETYDAMMMNADEFCDDEHQTFLPRTYAEIEYDNFDTAEAIEGAKFDDLNYLRYRER